MIKVSFSKISPRNFRCGQILEGNDSEQYIVVDVTEDDTEIATLRIVDNDERVKPEFLDGRVQITDPC